MTKTSNGFLIKENSGEATDVVTEGLRHTLLNLLQILEAMPSYQAMEREKLTVIDYGGFYTKRLLRCNGFRSAFHASELLIKLLWIILLGLVPLRLPFFVQLFHFFF